MSYPSGAQPGEPSSGNTPETTPATSQPSQQGAATTAYASGSPYPQPTGLGPHPVPGQRRNRGIVLGLVVAVLMAVAGLAIFGIVARSTGWSGFTWGLILAFIPVVPLVAIFLWLDRYEPEPAKYVLFALCWGAFIATLVSIFINSGAAALMGESRGGGARAAVFVAPPVEEFAKGAVILLLALVRRKEFDGIIDGLVYAGMAGIGFAFTENILYIGRVFNQLSEEVGSDEALRGAFGLFLLRCVMSPFAHPLFTAFTAIGVGIAVRHRSTVVRWLAPVVGYLAAVLAHALWNGGATMLGGGFILVYLFLMVPIFTGLVVFALLMRSRESQMIASRLYDYVRFGWMAPQDVPLVATLRGRKALRQNAKRYGAQAEDAAKDYQRTATELAYLRDKIVRQVIGPEAMETEKSLLDELRQRRPGVPFPQLPQFGPPQVAPAGPGVYGGPQGGYGPYPPRN